MAVIYRENRIYTHLNVISPKIVHQESATVSETFLSRIGTWMQQIQKNRMSICSQVIPDTKTKDAALVRTSAIPGGNDS